MVKTVKRKRRRHELTNVVRKKHNYTSKFSNTYYSSGDGMLTTVWGPPKWHYLHTLSFNYPVKPSTNDKKYYKQAITVLQYTLPCKYCRINFKQNLKVLPITKKVMENRNTFSKYIYDLHNLVNKMLGKSTYLTYEEVRDRYENFRARCSKKEVDAKTILLKEKGCTQPLYGEKSKCIIKIVPQNDKGESFSMDHKCIRRH